MISTSNQYKYHLATPAEQRQHHGKWFCPSCGKKEFVCYVDDNGDVLNESVGKCERINSCQYHYTPKEYYNDNDIKSSIVTDFRPKKPQYKPEPPTSYINPDIFKKSVNATKNHKNNLIIFLCDVFGVDATNKMTTDYFIGTAKVWDGSSVFWQIDINGNIRSGKVMQYNPKDGKRVKEPYNHVQWVHKVMNLENYNLKQCLFGEHLLKDSKKVVAVVESEKTAVITSLFLPDAIVVASGGCGNLSSKLCQPLRGRNVIFYPDNGMFDKWNDKVKEMSQIFKGYAISVVMEHHAQHDGDDIGDLIVSEWRKCPELSTIIRIREMLGFKETSPASAPAKNMDGCPAKPKRISTIIDEWSELNPSFKSLIDNLDLMICDESNYRPK